MGQTTLQFVQQFRMTSREKLYGAEKKVVNRHLTATSPTICVESGWFCKLLMAYQSLF
jgi:hypothetical protein